MPTRRQFLSRSALGLPAAFAAATWSHSAEAVLAALAEHAGSAEDIARDEDFWFEVGRAFTVDRSLVNLNNGGVSPAPAFVQEAMKRRLDLSHQAPSYTMWQVLEPQRETVRARLAQEWGVSPEEIALTRNASEGLQICQFGFDLKAGDEVLATDQDYGRMLTTFRQRERREGIVLCTFEVPVPCNDPGEFVRRYREHITDRTRLILCCHMINLTGEILPVREIAALGRERGIPVIIDGAHALAHFDFSLRDLDCDFYATSLHKWLFAPHGTGLLYVRRDRIAGLWPLMAAPAELTDDIRKFEEIGTHPAANALAIAEALTFHQGLGGARKAARLRHLRDYWIEAARDIPGLRLHTSLEPGRACGIATMEIEGLDPTALAARLWEKHRIIVTPIVHGEQFRGIRVSPSVYTTLEELDRFADALRRAQREGL